MLTVPEAARRATRDPEAIRRWIRTGKLRSRKIGTQHVVEESDLEQLLDADEVAVPERWRRFEPGRPQPNWKEAVSRSRRGH